MMNNKIYCEDSLQTLKTFPDESVDCCVTSPPYWGLRDYNVPGQLGLEKTPEEYVAKMVEIFKEVKRVLKKEGVMFLNLGDSYSGSCQGAGRRTKERVECKVKENLGSSVNYLQKYGHTLTTKPPTAKIEGIKPKNLIGIPWRAAFALQANGWYLRQDIIWYKPNPTPAGEDEDKNGAL